MEQKYNDLSNLIAQDVQANRYFNSLPGYVKDSIKQRGSNVNTLGNLKDYAENLLRGDD